MYDLRNEPHEFVAEDRDEAVSKACQFFGAKEDELAITELSPADVSGLANRTVVVAVPRDRQVRRQSERPDRDRDRDRDRDARPRERRGGRDRESGRREPRERGGNRGERRGTEAREPRQEGGRGGRGGRGERERGPRRGGRDDEREDRDDREERERSHSSEPSVGTARGELSEVGQFLLGLIERMDLGPFEIGESAEGEMVVFEIAGDAGQDLAQGSGRAVDALQLLANQAALRVDPEHARVVVDVEGDAEAREEFLNGLAQRVARRARESGRSVALDPMNGRDRRLIHLALRDDDGIATMSRGEGRYRQVLVVPEGAPEFDEAMRESSRAATRQD